MEIAVEPSLVLEAKLNAGRYSFSPQLQFATTRLLEHSGSREAFSMREKNALLRANLSHFPMTPFPNAAFLG